MAFNVNEFRTRLTNGGARPNQFIVNLGTRVDPGLASFLVTSASLPGQTIGTASVFYRGREVKLPGDKSFAPWTTTILNDGNLSIRKQIEGLMDRIESNVDKAGQVALREYETVLEVQQLDKNSAIIHSYKLIGAYPTDISEIGLDFGANDTISSFTCTWNYQYFIYDGSTDSPISVPQVSSFDGAL
jgi:hypothetical protein